MTAVVVDPRVGLTSAQVAEREAAGQVNAVKDRNARSLGDIFRANTFTYFNALIGSLWVLMLVSAPFIDSLFGFVIVINTAIGVVQEYRAARTLAKLSLVGQQQALVRRDGTDAEVPPSAIVMDEVIVIRTGDQMLVDSEVLESSGLELDESLLTGEADPVEKEPGAEVLSGSFVVAGSGLVRATRIGHESYAARLADEASRFSLTRSELRDSIQRFIKYVSIALVPIAVFLFVSQYRASDGSIRASIAGTVPGVITMVPEGLVLLTSIAMAVSVVSLARKRALVQDMPAVEVLARVDVVCVDKTGTLTEPGMAVHEVVVLDDGLPVDDSLGALGASEPEPNQTLAAIAARYPRPDGWAVSDTVPFSSARKWSSATFGERGAWVVGAPEMLLPEGDPVRSRGDELAREGARVLLLALSSGQPSAETGPGELRPAALVVINQTLRHDAADTVRYFLDQDVRLMVISGDNAVTVGAIAAQAGIPGADSPYDARQLPDDDPQALAEVLEEHSVFGRVTPAQKRAMVGALQSHGHVVAMTGDGVNDVLALKDADLGIAMGSGAGATRSVAQIVLLDDAFSVMPSVVAEGRRVLGNVERVSDLFLTKSFYAVTISIATIVFTQPFPFLNRHLTIVTALTIGTPAFFLALLPNKQRFRPGFFRRVLRFAVPAGVINALSAYVTYDYVLHLDYSVEVARASSVVTLFVVAWWVLVQVARPINLVRGVIVGAMLVGFLGVLHIPVLSRLFALGWSLDVPGLVAVGVGVVGAGAVTVVHAFAGHGTPDGEDGEPARAPLRLGAAAPGSAG